MNLLSNQYKVQDLDSGEISIWDEQTMLDYINADRSNEWTDYVSGDLLEGWTEWCEGNGYKLLSKNDNPVFGTVACKDMVEYYLINLFNTMGMDIPENYEDIVQDCYEDVMETADAEKWHSGDVTIAFRRWIEKQGE